MGTFNSNLQGKIEKLQKTVDTLLHIGENMDLSLIHICDNGNDFSILFFLCHGSIKNVSL